MDVFNFITVLCILQASFFASYVLSVTNGKPINEDGLNSSYRSEELHRLKIRDVNESEIALPESRGVSAGNSSAKSENEEIVDRSERGSSTCQFPVTKKDSTLMCVTHPNYVMCKQMCSFGHTLASGIQRDYKCVHGENRWIPDIENDNCLPFVDCTLRIVGSGQYTCYPGTNGNGPTCKVACDHYEDKPPVSLFSYQCDINGKWSPNLPHCASPGTGKSLVPAPSGIKYFK